MVRRRAIALEYDGEAAPRVSATGQDALAERIIAVARKHGVPMVENNELAVLLAQLDLGDEIPETLYLCVAQIIAFAMIKSGVTLTPAKSVEAFRRLTYSMVRVASTSTKMLT